MKGSAIHLASASSTVCMAMVMDTPSGRVRCGLSRRRGASTDLGVQLTVKQDQSCGKYIYHLQLTISRLRSYKLTLKLSLGLVPPSWKVVSAKQ